MSIFVFFIKEIWIWAMTRHHAKSNIKILLARNLTIDSGVRQWSQPLMIDTTALLWAKSNNRARGQLECDMTWFCFYFNFVCSQAGCGCCSIVCWRREFRLKLDVQGQDNFHGRRMFIVLYRKVDSLILF